MFICLTDYIISMSIMQNLVCLIKNNHTVNIDCQGLSVEECVNLTNNRLPLKEQHVIRLNIGDHDKIVEIGSIIEQIIHWQGYCMGISNLNMEEKDLVLKISKGIVLD